MNKGLRRELYLYARIPLSGGLAIDEPNVATLRALSRMEKRGHVHVVRTRDTIAVEFIGQPLKWFWDRADYPEAEGLSAVRMRAP